MKKTPEEIDALRAKYAAQNADKDQKRAEKKAKFSEANADKNMPVVECLIPWTMSWLADDGSVRTKDIDATKPPWDDWAERAERGYRVDVWLRTEVWPTYPVKVILVRTESGGP